MEMLKKIISTFLLLSLVLSLIACASKEDKINILVMFPFTGEAASYGKVLKGGIEVAISEITDPKLKDKINVIYQDSKLSVTEVLNIYKQETTLHKITAVLPASTADVMALGPLCNNDKIICIPPLADGDKITESGPYVFRVSPSSTFQANVLAEAVNKQGFTETAVLYLNDAWGRGLAERFKSTYEIMGGKVKAFESVNPKQTDMRTQLNKINYSKTKSVVILLHPPETIPALRQIKELGLDLKIFGGDNFSNKDIYNIASDVAQGVIFTLPAQPASSEFHNFNKKYLELTGSNADINAAAAYDAINIIISLVSQGEYTGEKIMAKLLKNKDGFKGATGLIKWDNTGEIISKTYNLYIVKNNGYSLL